jgi:hypothetical protein
MKVDGVFFKLDNPKGEMSPDIYSFELVLFTVLEVLENTDKTFTVAGIRSH